MSNGIDVPRAIRNQVDIIGDLLAAASDLDASNAAGKLAQIETLAARTYATAIQCQAQLATGLASGLAIAHYAPAVADAQESQPAVPTRERARKRRRAIDASGAAPRTTRGSRRAPSR